MKVRRWWRRGLRGRFGLEDMGQLLWILTDGRREPWQVFEQHVLRGRCWLRAVGQTGGAQPQGSEKVQR